MARAGLRRSAMSTSTSGRRDGSRHNANGRSHTVGAASPAPAIAAALMLAPPMSQPTMAPLTTSRARPVPDTLVVSPFDSALMLSLSKDERVAQGGACRTTSASYDPSTMLTLA